MNDLLEEIISIRERSMKEQMQELEAKLPKWRESLDTYNRIIRDCNADKRLDKNVREEITSLLTHTRDYMQESVINGSSRYAKFYKMMNNGYSQ